jgi:glycosyltransferase involved in cell wall biosynthesis
VEGFGIVVLEANACGTPVIASSGVPESAVRHGFNGLRYPFGNIPALTENIINILKDNELYRRLSANSLAFAKRFGWRKVGAQFEEVIMRIVNRKTVTSSGMCLD